MSSFPARRSPPARWSSESGFTIVESIVGLVLVVVLFVTAATTLHMATRQQSEVRVRQQAVAIAGQQLEDARSLAWTELEMTTQPSASDPNVSGGLLLASPFNLPADEPLVVDSGVYTPEDPDPGMVATEVAAFATLDGVAFDLKQYVTQPAPGVRRVVVVVSWALHGLARQHVATTKIAEVTR